MRSDMSKVVTERPRSGHSNTSLKTGGKIHRDRFEDDDHGPVHLKASRRGQYGWNAKEFTDVLGPLRGYLRKQVGRPWNKVYSELCQFLDRRSMSGLHIWNHVKSEVEFHCVIMGRAVFSKTAIYGNRYRVTGLYVHPRTGLLCDAKKVKEPKSKKEVDSIPVSDLTELHKNEGIWFHLTYEMQPDIYLEYNRVTRSFVDKRRPVDKKVLVKKRQLNSKELRRYNLENNPEVHPLSRTELRQFRIGA